MSRRLNEKLRENISLQGGRPQRRTTPVPSDDDAAPSEGPGKRSDEKIISLPIDEILPDRYQGRLRWPGDSQQLARLYTGEWDAQDVLDYLAQLRREVPTPALEEAWETTVELARSILSEGQVAPITVYPQRNLPLGVRYVIETGEGRYWAFQMMRWLLHHAPTQLGVEAETWREDPAFIRAVAISSPSRLRQVAENEQRQSYASAVDRAVAYASMLAEEAGYEVEGVSPGIHGDQLELPDAYWRAAQRGLRGQQKVVRQVPAGKRQIQRHLKLLTDLDRAVLARAKQHGLTEAQLRPLVTQPAEEQRLLVERIIEEGLSSREAARALDEGEEGMEPTEPETPSRRRREPLTLPEEVTRLLRSLTAAAGRLDSLRQNIGDEQIAALLEVELRSYDESARGAQRARTPRRRLQQLISFLERIE